MEITREEFKALKLFYKGKNIDISDDILLVLFHKKLVEYEGYVRGSTSFSYKPDITNRGKIVYENYHDNKLSVRRANIQSWIAIAISAGSFVLSLISLLNKI